MVQSNRPNNDNDEMSNNLQFISFAVSRLQTHPRLHKLLQQLCQEELRELKALILKKGYKPADITNEDTRRVKELCTQIKTKIEKEIASIQ